MCAASFSQPLTRPSSSTSSRPSPHALPAWSAASASHREHTHTHTHTVVRLHRLPARRMSRRRPPGTGAWGGANQPRTRLGARAARRHRDAARLGAGQPPRRDRRGRVLRVDAPADELHPRPLHVLDRDVRGEHLERGWLGKKNERSGERNDAARVTIGRRRRDCRRNHHARRVRGEHSPRRALFLTPTTSNREVYERQRAQRALTQRSEYEHHGCLALHASRCARAPKSPAFSPSCASSAYRLCIP